MAFVGNDAFEGVNRDVEPFGVVVAFLVAFARRLASRPEGLSPSAESCRRRRRRDQAVGLVEDTTGENRRVELLVLPVVFQVFLAESLTEDLINPVELEAGLRLERGERPTAWAASARRSTRKRTRLETPF